MTYHLEILGVGYETLAELTFDTLERAYQYVEQFAAKHHAQVEWHTKYHAGVYGRGERYRISIDDCHE